MNSAASTSRRRVLRAAASLFICVPLWLIGLFCAGPVQAADTAKHSFDIPAGPAEESLKLFSSQSGRAVLFSTEGVKNLRTQALRGNFTAHEAIGRMLEGTDLVVTLDEKSGAFGVKRRRDPNVPGVAATSDSHPGGKGTIEGRVFDQSRGGFLETVRITVEGTSLEAFTDASGHFRLTEVPSGRARLKAFFTGLPSRIVEVEVRTGETITQDISFSAAGQDDEAIQLGEFLVTASRDMDGAAIAIHEQRFARNIINVVASDEFGLVYDGTPGEVMKFLPGLTMEYSAGEARTVSLNGVPSDNVPITVGGFDLASAAGNSNSRVVNLDQFSVNSITRVEVVHSPTPESPGNALAGSVNLVPRSAFERSRASYKGSFFFMMKDAERSLQRTAGPMDGEKTRKITPGFNFSAVVPVNKRFGFTISGNYADQYSFQDVITKTWRGAGSATDSAAGLPATTPDSPYMTDFAVRDSTRDNRTYSVGATVDYKPSRSDTLSLSFQYTFIAVLNNNRTFSNFINRVSPGGWGPTFTNPAPGNFGEVRVQGSARDWLGTTVSPTLVWRHNGPVWKSTLGLGYSRASLHIRAMDKGYFSATQARRTGVNVAFGEIDFLRPRQIAVTDSTGATVDQYNLNNYAFVSANDDPRESVDLKERVYGDLSRDFSAGGIPLSVKVGFDVRRSVRDLTGGTRNFNYVGPDGIASTSPAGSSDDNAGPLLDLAFASRPGRFGLPTIPWIDNVKAFRLYKEHPEYFTTDANATYRSFVGRSKRADEIVSAAYVRGDASFFRRRLQLVGGVRAEQTNIKARGPLTDPTRNFQRDAAGNVIFSAPGTPALIFPTSNALAVSQLTFVERGQRTNREYLRFFPSLNASFALRDNLIARTAYYQTIGRPNFDEYAGGLTLPNTEALPSNSNRIQVNNAGIKPWQAETYKVRLEYYFERVGQISIGGFRREFENFFGGTVFEATPEFLAFYDLDPSEYLGYQVSTKRNLTDTVTMNGFEIDYKQALTFLPDWARGLQVFANYSSQRAKGNASANFAGFIPRSGSWGISLVRPKYVVKGSWSYQGRARQGIITGQSIEAGTYNWREERIYFDLVAEYALRRGVTVFANMRNLASETQDNTVEGPNTPVFARFRAREAYGSAWTFGVRAEY